MKAGWVWWPALAYGTAAFPRSWPPSSLPRFAGLLIQRCVLGSFPTGGKEKRRCSLPSSVSWRHLGFPRDGGGSAFTCPTLHGAARETFPIPGVAPIQLSLELNPKPSKKSLSIRTISCTLFLGGDARPSPGAGHTGCPHLGIGVSLPTAPREAMPLVEEAAPVFVLGSSCQGGGKGWSVGKVRPLTQPGRNHPVLLSPRGSSCCAFWGGQDGLFSCNLCKTRLNLSNLHLLTSSALLSRL